MLMQLDVPYLKLMVAIADGGGITAAARRLFLTQSALSHRLSALERKLGVALFEREKGRLVLTSAGTQLVSAARRILADLEDVERRIRQGQRQEPASIRIATECYTCYHWLPPVLTSFRGSWPFADFAVVSSATAQPVRALLAGEVDVAIVHEHPREARVRYHPLFDDELVLVLPRGHALAGKAYVTAEDFVGLNLFLYQTSQGDTTVEREVLRPSGVTPAHLTRLQLTEAIIEFVKAGIGATVMARWAVAPQVNAGQLDTVRVTRRGLSRRWSAAVLNDAELSPHIADFLQHLTHDAFDGVSAARLSLTA